MEMREPNLWIQHWTMISLLVVDILHNTWHCYNTCVYKTPSFPFNNMLLSTGYVYMCYNHICTSTTICTPSDTYPHTNIPTHKQTSTHTHTSIHCQSLAMSLRNPSSCVGERLCRTSERPRSVAIFLLSGRFCKWVRRRLMLLGDSAGLSLTCRNLHTERTNTSLRTWLSLEQIPSSTVYYHNCNYERTQWPYFSI